MQELEEQLAVITKRKSRKRKQIQHSGTLKYGPAASWVAAKAQLFSAVGTAAKLDTTHKRARRVQKHLLNLIQARSMLGHCLIVSSCSCSNLC
ncbi:uncharacterized protein M421DRAFT_67287 [Didymella exigua CBS 183.55]|uniref:Uncharacterized protein n=1 Tax=Didymella exigua CBS 183.55 TaxID=1150837 RepID=A0A6A5RHH4_9PLEO|nr:uncharacterized protein M421DRAFT_67287 [Didymella exigua CBS 183.55]KAF1926690.1 hypothetical protein M421DRAFT_67287 [Didymella exigua CBS 183.55]